MKFSKQISLLITGRHVKLQNCLFWWVRVANLFSFLCCGFWWVRVAHLFSFLCCGFWWVRVAHLFSFLCCGFWWVRVAHLFSFLCCGFWWVRVANLFSFLCCPTIRLYLMSSVLWYPLPFHIKTIFGSSLPPFVFRGAYVLFTLFVLACV